MAEAASAAADEMNLPAGWSRAQLPEAAPVWITNGMCWGAGKACVRENSVLTLLYL